MQLNLRLCPVKKIQMANKEFQNTIYAPATLEFVTVAAQFCVFLEQSQGRRKRAFVETMLRLLPLLYVKATLLPRIESDGAFLPDDKVTEEDYNFIRQTVYDIMQADDDYEELVYDATIQTDENRWLSVSEGLADMYQAIRNFVGVYQERIEDCMTDALWAVMDNFELYWGQSLVDTLRQLHKLRYTQQKDLDEDTL